MLLFVIRERVKVVWLRSVQILTIISHKIFRANMPFKGTICMYVCYVSWIDHMTRQNEASSKLRSTRNDDTLLATAYAYQCTVTNFCSYQVRYYTYERQLAGFTTENQYSCSLSSTTKQNKINCSQDDALLLRSAG